MKTIRALVGFLRDFFSEAVLGCGHRHLTRPFTLEHETYMVCLDCGERLRYSTDLMRPLTPREVRRMRRGETERVRVMPSRTNIPDVPRLTPERGRRNDAA